MPDITPEELRSAADNKERCCTISDWTADAVADMRRAADTIERQAAQLKGLQADFASLSQSCAEYALRISELEQQVAALRADAERLDIIINGMSTRDVADCHLCGRLREAADAAIDAARNADRKGE